MPLDSHLDSPIMPEFPSNVTNLFPQEIDTMQYEKKIFYYMLASFVLDREATREEIDRLYTFLNSEGISIDFYSKEIQSGTFLDISDFPEIKDVWDLVSYIENLDNPAEKRLELLEKVFWKEGTLSWIWDKVRECFNV